jgi:hypothetical protein
MPRPDNTKRIKQRRDAIAKRLAMLDRLEQRIYSEKPKLKAEDRDLAAAEKLLDHLALVNDDDLLGDFSDLVEESESSSSKEEKSKNPPAVQRFGTPRPEGIPPTSQMIDTVLLGAERVGKAGLRGFELVAAIQRNWWPGVGSNSILPTAFALVKAKRLGRKGKLFVRVKREATTTAAESSEAKTASH